jgi:hypothetical protein
MKPKEGTTKVVKTKMKKVMKNQGRPQWKQMQARNT